ncbi:MAG: glycosyltransferase [bacterium]|nr:glycosyltransferase [bacterium]
MRSRCQRTAVFVKRPDPGAVKTRLAPAIGEAQAARLQNAMLEDAVRIHGSRSGFELVVAPPGSGPWFEEHFAGTRVCEQRGEGLGERLANWFAEQADAPGSSVVIGADCPSLAPAVIDAAHERIGEGVDVVLAPDGGGGYALVGLARPVPELFTQVTMSAPDMLPATIDLATSLGLSIELLPVQLDVDTEADLRRLRRQLNTLLESVGPGRDFPARTHAVLLEIAESCPA